MKSLRGKYGADLRIKAWLFQSHVNLACQRYPLNFMPTVREKKQLMSASEIDRTLVRLAHEILEKTSDLRSLAFIGIKRRGVPLAHRLAQKIEALENCKVPVGILDISLYRDDLSTIGERPVLNSRQIDFPVVGKDVVLMDDVLYTGRTIRVGTGRTFRSWPPLPRTASGVDRPRTSRTAYRSPLRGSHGANQQAGNHRSEIPGDRRAGKGDVG